MIADNWNKNKLSNYNTFNFQSDPPFVNESESSKDGFEGFAIDIVRELAKRMDFDYTFKVLESGGSGSKKDGKWNGFVGSLIEKVCSLFIVE